jgi:hypothetical protein
MRPWKLAENNNKHTSTKYQKLESFGRSSFSFLHLTKDLIPNSIKIEGKKLCNKLIFSTFTKDYISDFHNYKINCRIKKWLLAISLQPLENKLTANSLSISQSIILIVYI